jgi:hypothetical protein
MTPKVHVENPMKMYHLLYKNEIIFIEEADSLQHFIQLIGEEFDTIDYSDPGYTIETRELLDVDRGYGE